MLATFYGNKEITEFLIKNGANKTINQKTNKGQTALYFAQENGYHYLEKLLISNGADINIKNGDGFSYTDRVNNFKKKYLNKYFKLKENTPACSNKNYINGATTSKYII